jgi:sigma-B regulation protein RsbU (phosphoserine phosphatase)
MATARALIRQRSLMPGTIGEVVGDVNRQLARDVVDSGSFMTLYYLAVDVKNRRLSWVRAGHDPALLYDPRNDVLKALKGPGPALGLDADAVYTEQVHHGFAAGQIVVIYTDGVWEAHNTRGEMFGKKNLRTIIRANAALSAQQIATAILDALNTFQSGEPLADDITLIVVKFDNFAKSRRE